jgi:hypothetical protein
MPVIVKLHIFSGRENPNWELTLDQVADLKNRLMNLQSTAKRAKVAGGLGYTGLSISGLEKASHIFRGVMSFNEKTPSQKVGLEFEQWLLDTGSQILPAALLAYAREEIKDVPNLRWAEGAQTADPALWADLEIDPKKWHEGTDKYNNCYNYANDLPTDTFAQPGRSDGKEVEGLFDCTNVGDAAESDGLVRVGNRVSDLKNVLTEGQGHYVALVIDPVGDDYHWYRRDKRGYWSHKPGEQPFRLFDESAYRIQDPESCNRGPYDIFCGYFQSIPGKAKIE